MLLPLQAVLGTSFSCVMQFWSSSQPSHQSALPLLLLYPVCSAVTLNTYFSCPPLAWPAVCLQAAPGLLPSGGQVLPGLSTAARKCSILSFSCGQMLQPGRMMFSSLMSGGLLQPSLQALAQGVPTRCAKGDAVLSALVQSAARFLGQTHHRACLPAGEQQGFALAHWLEVHRQVCIAVHCLGNGASSPHRASPSLLGSTVLSWHVASEHPPPCHS